MFRRPGTGPSRASADTLCQKCLKRGHYSYECKASAQERPYKSRPSRTQQLLNPKLQPKLTTEVPDVLVRRKGLADDLLKQKEADRRCSRSPSTSSADSVSTISTNRSPSRSPAPPRHKHQPPMPSRAREKAPAMRRKRSVSIESRSSDAERPCERNTRRRITSISPDERGRPTSRSRSSRMRPSIERGAGGASRDRSLSAPSVHVEGVEPRNGAAKGAWRPLASTQRAAYQVSRDRSPSPYTKRAAARRSPSSPPARGGHGSHDTSRVSARNRFGDEPAVPAHRVEPPLARPDPPQSKRERSLSPFSKRVALTRAMQAG